MSRNDALVPAIVALNDVRWFLSNFHLHPSHSFQETNVAHRTSFDIFFFKIFLFIYFSSINIVRKSILSFLSKKVTSVSNIIKSKTNNNIFFLINTSAECSFFQRVTLDFLAGCNGQWQTQKKGRKAAMAEYRSKILTYFTIAVNWRTLRPKVSSVPPSCGVKRRVNAISY